MAKNSKNIGNEMFFAVHVEGVTLTQVKQMWSIARQCSVCVLGSACLDFLSFGGSSMA